MGRNKSKVLFAFVLEKIELFYSQKWSDRVQSSFTNNFTVKYNQVMKVKAS